LVGSKKKLGEAVREVQISSDERLLDLCRSFQKTIKKLRAPDGCPWDREQTIETLRPFLIEECYEAVSANEALCAGKEDGAAMYCDELGDVLLQVFLNAAIAEEQGLFTVADVFNGINEKMIRRHPHVFAKETSSAKTSNDVLVQWADIKNTEGKNSTEKPKSLLHKAIKKRILPTLSYGCEISKRTLDFGFQWTEMKDVFRDLENEVRELSDEVFKESPDIRKISDESGDVIYALCNVVAFLRERSEVGKHLDLDIAARNAFEKFSARFSIMESIMQERNDPLTEERAKTLSLDEWNDLWKLAKGRLAKPQTP
jgi:tetrapyrrole methylase family protein/MazG family protein